MIRAQIGHLATTKTRVLKLSHDHVAEISIQGVTYDDIRPHKMIFGMICMMTLDSVMMGRKLIFFSEYKRLDDLLIDLIIRRKFPGIRTLYHARLNSFYVILP